MSQIKIYLARGMSGRSKAEVVKEAKRDKEFLEKAGFKVLCPVLEEGIKAESGEILASIEEMNEHWRRDKAMIREAHVVWDMTPHLKSEGVLHEIGYARYHLWKKVFRIFPAGQLPPPSSIAFYEDDYVTDDLMDAVGELLRAHGTLLKRLNWRLSLYNRCFLKAVWYRLQEWFK